MKTYPIEILNAKHKDYETANYRKRTLLYEGGSKILEPDNAALFLPKLSEYEHPEAYRQRLACATYTNNFAKAVNFYVSQLFTKKLTVLPKDKLTADPFYQELESDADWKGTSYRDFLQGVMTDLLVHGEAIVAADLPVAKAEALNRFQEEQGETERAYLMRIPHENLIDWEEDERGSFKWVRLSKTFQRSAGPYVPRKKWTTEFRTIKREENGEIGWEAFELEHDYPTPPERGADVPLIAEGKASFTRFNLVRIKMPPGLWLGNKIGSKCADHFRIQTGLFYSEMRTLFAAPVYKKGAPPENATQFDEYEARSDDAAAQFVSKGWLTIAANDEVFYLEPGGGCYELINTQLKEMQDDIGRIADQMAQTIAATQGVSRSAASKVQDNHSTEIILEELGAIAKAVSLKLYQLVADGRKEIIEWEAKGMCEYKIVDRKDLLEEALTIANIVSGIVSQRAQVLYTQQVALSLIRNLTLEDEKTICQEIEDAYKNGAMPMSHPDEEAEEDDEEKEMNDDEEKPKSKEDGKAE